jgi:hypothetical protein
MSTFTRSHSKKRSRLDSNEEDHPIHGSGFASVTKKRSRLETTIAGDHPIHAYVNRSQLETIAEEHPDSDSDSDSDWLSFMEQQQLPHKTGRIYLQDGVYMQEGTSILPTGTDLLFCPSLSVSMSAVCVQYNLSSCLNDFEKLVI